MGVRRITYRPDRPGRTAPYPGSPFLPFGAFAVSPRMQGLALKIGRDVATIAKMMVPASDDDRNGHYRDKFVVVPGPVVRIKGLKRVTASVENTADSAAALEFGSGGTGTGEGSSGERPQGGYNKPMRPLGKAGMMIGDFHEGDG